MTRGLLGFLEELREHNRREWFEANKHRYVDEVRGPLLAFVTAIGPKLRTISPHIVADPRPSGGSLLRVYRDTRFTRDKTPYRTNAGLRFPIVDDKQIEAPGYYLHLERGQSFMGAGMWHPSSEALRAIRDAIVDDPQGWKRSRRSGLSHPESALKRPPRGFDPAHPLIEDLKHTSFTVGVTFTDQQVCARTFPALFVRACRREAPLVRFLAKAMGLSF